MNRAEGLEIRGGMEARHCTAEAERRNAGDRSKEQDKIPRRSKEPPEPGGAGDHGADGVRLVPGISCEMLTSADIYTQSIQV